MKIQSVNLSTVHSFSPSILECFNLSKIEDLTRYVSQASLAEGLGGCRPGPLWVRLLKYEKQSPLLPSLQYPQYPNTQRMETQRMDARMATATTWMPRVCWITWICKWICQESARRKRCGRVGGCLKAKRL